MKIFAFITAGSVVFASCLWLPLAHTSQVRPVPDFDQNGAVDFPDFLLFVGKFGSKQGDERYEDRFDLDGNGTIGFSDFLNFVNDFGKASLEGGLCLTVIFRYSLGREGCFSSVLIGVHRWLLLPLSCPSFHPANPDLPFHPRPSASICG